ncbi:hypothetical protein D3C85_1914210 [compost metagenome]
MWIINGEPAKVTWQQVKVQRLDDGTARVIGQLKPGDQIVALGAHMLREGDLVRVGRQATATAEGARP